MRALGPMKMITAPPKEDAAVLREFATRLHGMLQEAGVVPRAAKLMFHPHVRCALLGFNAWFVRSCESHACMWTPDLVCQLFSTGALLLAAALPQHPAEPPEEAMKS